MNKSFEKRGVMTVCSQIVHDSHFELCVTYIIKTSKLMNWYILVESMFQGSNVEHSVPKIN